MPAPTSSNVTPNIRARHACHRHFEDILPRTTCTFHVAPEAGWARRKLPRECLRRVVLTPPPARRAGITSAAYTNQTNDEHEK
ncbi:hypothetical protein DOY81_015235 [Sarcophaga bullata]|nr:hypothetical protein DOY81_015235 [Sarcophaga bullata]